MTEAIFPPLASSTEVILLAGVGRPHDNSPLGTHIVHGGSNGAGWFNPGEAYPVTRVTTNWVWVRIPGGYESNGTTIQINRNRYAGNPHQVSEAYQSTGADYVPPRKLGDVPAGDHIAQDDPRIQWLWADLEAYANNQSWCRQYDDLAKAVGIPGRTQAFKVSHRLGDLTISSTFRARTQDEAQAMLMAQIAATVPAAR